MAEIEYERRDVDIRFAAKVCLGFLLLALFGGAVSLGVYRLIGRSQERQDRPAGPMAQAPGRLPPVPRLQSTPQTDLAQLRAQHRRELTSYGWVNPQAGTTRIHIEEAMRLYVERAGTRPGAAGAAAPAPSASPPPRPHP